MKVLGIAGSLRANSNTLEYVNTALKVIQAEGIETELISLRGKEIKPCNGCYECVECGYGRHRRCQGCPGRRRGDGNRHQFCR